MYSIYFEKEATIKYVLYFLRKVFYIFQFLNYALSGNSSYIITEHYSEDSNVASIKQNI